MTTFLTFLRRGFLVSAVLYSLTRMSTIPSTLCSTPARQWAAVTKCLSVTMLAPQKILEPDTARLACQGTDPSSAVTPPTMRLKELEERPSKSWILTALEKAAGITGREKPERLFTIDDLAEVSPHLQFKDDVTLVEDWLATFPDPKQPILHLNLSDVEATFWDPKMSDLLKAM